MEYKNNLKVGDKLLVVDMCPKNTTLSTTRITHTEMKLGDVCTIIEVFDNYVIVDKSRALGLPLKHFLYIAISIEDCIKLLKGLKQLIKNGTQT